MKRKRKKERFKLHWACKPIGDGLGNALGYTTHERTLHRYVSKIADLTPDAEAALTIISPEQYVNPPQPYINFLFTMFEGTTLPDIYIENMARADFLIAPSTWVKERFNQYFPPEKTFVCPHGVESIFHYYKRSFPKLGELFVYLWVGAPNPRKGYEPIIMIWQEMGFNNNPAVLLYMKTTKLGKFERRGNVILDSRKLSIHQLYGLYKRAHCFIMPTQGEGFGLTACEAMRTGLPCIVTHYSGITDFFDEQVGYLVGYEMGEGVVTFPGTKMRHKTMVAKPKMEDILNHMLYVYENYNIALKKGKKASERISQNFTWPRSAKILIDGIKDKITN